MKPSKTDYRGGAALRLATGRLELVVTTSVGPRIVSLRSLRGRAGNLFLELPPGQTRYHGYHLRGGHRLWHAPEDIVRSYQPDDEPVAVAPLPAGAAFTQPTEPKTGLQKGFKVELLGAGTVRVTHTLANRGIWPVACAPWALTMLRGGGYAALPLPPKGSHEGGDLLPTSPLIPWPFTDLSQPVWDWHREFIGVDVARARSAQKLGLAQFPGWAAYWSRGATLVKFSRAVAGATYPDLGSRFEVFTNGSMIELETLGPLATLAPGRTTTHVEFWTVLDGMARPSSDAAFAKLAAAVKRWLATLPGQSAEARRA